MKKFRKISFIVLLVILLFGVIGPVFAADDITCTFGGSSVSIDKKIPNTVHLVILVIQVVVPILLVIFGSIDFIKGVTASKEDEIKKGRQTFISRLIAGVLVFFIMAIVKLVISVAAGSIDNTTIMNCANCFLNGVSDTNCKATK